MHLFIWSLFYLLQPPPHFISPLLLPFLRTAEYVVIMFHGNSLLFISYLQNLALAELFLSFKIKANQ